MMNLNSNPSLPVFAGLREIQQLSREYFLKKGFPTKNEERWKYTDLSVLMKQSWNWADPLDKTSEEALRRSFAALRMTEIARTAETARMAEVNRTTETTEATSRLVFVNGYLCEQQSNLPKGVIFKPISQISSNEWAIEYLKKEENESLLALNLALLGDGCFLYVPENVVIQVPIHFLFINTKQNNFHLSPRNFIIAGKNSCFTVLEEYLGVEAENYLTNTVTILHAKENSKVNYYKIQNEHATATHLANIKITQEKNSRVNTFSLGYGGKLVREDIHVMIQGENCETDLTGLYHLKHNQQHIDNHLLIEHRASHSKSNMFYKGILENKSSAVFNGKVLVPQQIAQTKAKQINRNLLLSNEAEVNTKPELEIYADDVKCTHGATVGYLNEEEIFYLRSRGIGEQEARQLLTRAFADDVLQKISDLSIRDYICQGVYAKLSS